MRQWNGVNCQRCYNPSTGFIMSMYDESMICADCKSSEEKRADYKEACDADVAAIRQGNFNFKGIGFK